MMDPWRKESLGLQVGDFISWQGEAVEGKPIPPTAIVQFESGMRLMVDERMKWERAN